MHYEQFIEKTFHAKSQAVIMQADEIIQEYAAQGFVLTLRQLYYQFVARGLVENTERSYKRIGGLVTDGRLAGLLPWDGIEDRNRGKKGWLIEEDIQEVLKDLPYGYAADMWGDQSVYIEVWVEKEALANVVQRACRRYRVPYMSCKGYLSVSEAYNAGKRLEAIYDAGKEVYVFHLGDHDPSGLDMTRDNRDRLDILSRQSPITVKRLALNMDQIEQYNPPPNPTKVTDSRAAGYLAEYGGTSWELDALEPSVVVDLITSEIEPLIDFSLWDEAKEREDHNRRLLRRVSERWDDIADLLEDE